MCVVMVQPNIACAGFCNWMLNISAQHLSGPQRIIVQDVFTAALAVTPISDQEWYNFNLFTAWRNPYYIVYRDYASSTNANLLLSLIAAYSFEGSSNDPVSHNNGTDTAVTYGAGTGKILQGAEFNGVNSIISVTAYPLAADFTISVWIKPNAPAGAFNAILANAGGTNGLYLKPGSMLMSYYDTIDHLSTTPLTDMVWQHIVVTRAGAALEFYYNGMSDGSYAGIINPNSSTNWGNDVPGEAFTGWLDIALVYTRALSATEVLQLYNAGAGIQYPFF